MVSVAIYVRLSEEDRNKAHIQQDSESIVNQKNMLTDFASEKGWSIYQIYSDDDYSGADETRPEFNAMIQDAKNGKFQVVLCKTLARFARDITIVEKYINGLFIEWGIRYLSLADFVDNSLKGSRKNIQINSLVNQWYLEDLSENIRSVMTHKKKLGQYTGSFTPYGYVKDKEDTHKMVVDPEAAKIVKRIFFLYIEGSGTKAIANMLNWDHIPCPSVYRQQMGYATNRRGYYLWSDHSVHLILTNPNYVGNVVQNRYSKPTYKSKVSVKLDESRWIQVNQTHEAIVTQEEYETAQKIRAFRRKHYRKSDDAVHEVNLFAGLVACKQCNRKLVTSGSGAGNKHVRYLRCTGRKSGVSGCACAMVKYDVLVRIVEDGIRTVIDEYCDRDRFNKRTGERTDWHTFELNALKKALCKTNAEQNKLDDALSALYLDKAAKTITEEQFIVIAKNIQNKKEALLSIGNATANQISHIESRRQSAQKSEQVVSKYVDFSCLSREILDAFIEKILIGERNDKEFDMDICWKI